METTRQGCYRVVMQSGKARPGPRPRQSCGITGIRSNLLNIRSLRDGRSRKKITRDRAWRGCNVVLRRHGMPRWRYFEHEADALAADPRITVTCDRTGKFTATA